MTTRGWVAPKPEKKSSEPLVNIDVLRKCVREFKIHGHTATHITVSIKDAVTLPPDVDGIPVIGHRHVAVNTVMVGNQDWESEL